MDKPGSYGGPRVNTSLLPTPDNQDSVSVWNQKMQVEKGSAANTEGDHHRKI